MWALNVVIPDLVGDPLDVGVKGMRYEARGVSRHPHPFGLAQGRLR